MALANVTEGPARATVLKVTQTEPSYGFVAWQALVDRYAPRIVDRSGNSAATHTCDAQELQRRKGIEGEDHGMVIGVAEYEHQFKVIDEAQKIFVVREMDDVEGYQAGVPDGTDKVRRNHGETTKSTQGDPDMSNDMSYEDVCAIAWKGYKAGKGAGKKGPNGSGP